MVQKQVEETMRDEDGIWLVLKWDGTSGILGRVEGHPKLTLNVRNQILSTGNNSLALDIAFDYAEMYKPMPIIGEDGKPVMGPTGPQMQMGREPIVSNVGFIFDKCRTYVRNWVRLDFYEDMSPTDKTRYEGYRDAALRGSEQRRMQEAGIIDPRQEGLNMNDPRLKRMIDPNGRPHFQVDLRPR